MTALKTKVALHLLSEMSRPLRNHLELVDAEAGLAISPELDQLLFKLSEARAAYASSSDDTLNELFILEKYVLLFGEYGILWQQITDSKFAESWSSLQNAFDMIRLIRRFSSVNVSAIEDQLYALEAAYPYNIFFSMGAVVDWFECSICGEDIDSFDCMHRKGELYRGHMAHGIARNIVRFDHVAMVENPVDKRCVIAYSNDSPQFSVLRYLRELLLRKEIFVSNFGGITWWQQRVENPEHKMLGRNDPCYCRSGRKFKKCCIENAFIVRDHAQILSTRTLIERAIA